MRQTRPLLPSWIRRSAPLALALATFATSEVDAQVRPSLTVRVDAPASGATVYWPLDRIGVSLDATGADNLQGVAGALLYDSQRLTYARGSFGSGTLFANGAPPFFERDDPAAGAFDFATGRTGDAGSSGTGSAAALAFMLRDQAQPGEARLRITDLDAVDPQGDPFTFGDVADGIVSIGGVWPGDANNDCAVDVNDLFPIARDLGSAGPARREANSVAWTAQAFSPWGGSSAAPRFGLSFVDANGNGVLDAGDVDMAQANIGSQRAPSTGCSPAPEGAGGQPTALRASSTSIPIPGEVGSTVEFEIGLSSPVRDLLGIAISIDHSESGATVVGLEPGSVFDGALKLVQPGATTFRAAFAQPGRTQAVTGTGSLIKVLVRIDRPGASIGLGSLQIASPEVTGTTPVDVGGVTVSNPVPAGSKRVAFLTSQQVLIVSESAGSVDLSLVLPAGDRTGLQAIATVSLLSGDPADLGGFTSATVAIGGPSDAAGPDGRYVVTVPITDDALAEPDESFVFGVSVESAPSAATALVAGEPSSITLTLTDDDSGSVTTTVSTRPGAFLFAAPFDGLTAQDIAPEHGQVYAFDPDVHAFVEAAASRRFARGEPILLDAATENGLSFTGLRGPDVASFAPFAAPMEGRLLAFVGNPTDHPVALSDVVVTGGTVADVLLVFSGGSFRPVSRAGLDAAGAEGRADALEIGPFEVVVLQVIPTGSPSSVTVSLDTRAGTATPPGSSPAAGSPFLPSAGETAVVLGLRAGGNTADVAALRFGVGASGVDPFDGLDVTTPTAPLLRFDASGAPLAALAPGTDLKAGPVTVPLDVRVPSAGTYAITLERDPGLIASRPVVVEILDGGVSLPLAPGAPVSFTTVPSETLSGRFSVRVSLQASVATDAAPETFSLDVYPNPATRRATLALTLDAPQHVRASVLNALGREVQVVLDAEASGAVRLDVDTSRLAPGVYVVRVSGTSFAEARRLTVVR